MTEDYVGKVLDEAKSWLRTPYHPCARVKGVGVDCGMLLIEVYSRSGVCPAFDPGSYRPDWHLHRSEEMYLEYVLQYFDEVPLESVKPGDVLVYRYGRTWSHGAIVVGDDTVIHAYIGLGVITSSTDEQPLSGRTPRAFTIKEK